MLSPISVQTALIAATSLLAGCGGIAPTSQNLVGWAIGDVQAQFGTPDVTSSQTVPASWAGAMGPRPTLLTPGDAYTSIMYQDIGGQQIHLFCVAPAIYQRVKGTSPGSKTEYVLEAVVAPAGAVY